jgi:hypothetical protein
MFLLCSNVKGKRNPRNTRVASVFAAFVLLTEKAARCCFPATPFGREIR